MDSFGQQSPQFANYLFNQYATNPAYSGESECTEMRMGRRTQWAGFDNNPKTVFASVNFSLPGRYFQTSWHTIGAYVENDKNDIFQSSVFLPSYSYHTRVTDKYVASAGVFAGLRISTLSTASLPQSDPVVKNSAAEVYTYPDIHAGLSLYSKKDFYSLGVRQIYKNSLRGHGSQIGKDSKLRQHFYFTAGRKFSHHSYSYTYIPTMQVRFVPMVKPSVDLSFFMFFKEKFGYGLTYRHRDALVGIIQFKLWGAYSASLAFELVTSKMRTGSSYSHEVMLGYSQCPETGVISRKQSECPTWDF